MTTTTELKPLTDRQREILVWLARYITEHGYSPTVRELGDAFGFGSTNAVMCHLRPLKSKGWITWVNRHSRTLRLTTATEGCDLGL